MFPTARRLDHCQWPDLHALTDSANKTVTFILDNGTDPTLITTGDTVININATDSPTDIVNAIALAVENAGLNVTVYTDTTLDRVEILGTAGSALTATLSAATAGNPLVLEGNGTTALPGGFTAINVNFGMNAAQVAQQVAAVMDATLSVNGTGNAVLIDTTQTNLIHMISHSVEPAGANADGTINYGPLPYAPGMPGDPSAAVHSIMVGQANTGEGLFIDDVIVGSAERGQMVTADPSDTTFDKIDNTVTDLIVNPTTNLGLNADATQVPVPEIPFLITNGSYVLQIREAQQYATLVDIAPSQIQLDQSFNTNDRLDTNYTLVTPSGPFIHTGDTFTLNDGNFSKTFEFVLEGLQPDAGDIPIFYAGNETASEIAGLVNTAINGQTAAPNPSNATSFAIYAAWNGTDNLTTTDPSNHVDLFNCQSATSDANLTADTQAYSDSQFDVQAATASSIDALGNQNNPTLVSGIKSTILFGIDQSFVPDVSTLGGETFTITDHTGVPR